MQIYLVGGCVRDLFMGRIPNDYDYVVVGATPEEMEAKGFKQVGADFPVFLHPTTGDEYALARIERKAGVGYHGFTVEYDPEVTLEEDLFRRDLSMNAMAHPIDGIDEDGKPYFDFHHTRIIDPFGGQEDIAKGYLRHVSDAFKEDPVRVLRVAKFAARYNFAIHPGTFARIQEMIQDGELDHLDPNRVWKEVSAGLMTRHPSMFFDVLKRTGALWVGALEAYAGGANYDVGGLMNVALNDLPLHIRFACVAEHFGEGAELFAEYRIPSECAELARAVNSFVRMAARWRDLSPEDRYAVLVGTGGLGSKRNTNLFTDFVKATHVRLTDIRIDRSWKMDLVQMAEACMSVRRINMEYSVKNAPPGTNIGELVKNAYIAALT